jgi:hypothetical protein
MIDLSDQTAIPSWLLSLSPLRFEETQHKNILIGRRATGTGQWLLESPEFLNWRDGESRKLWCYGIRKAVFPCIDPLTVISINLFLAGAGKTILAYVPSIARYLKISF